MAKAATLSTHVLDLVRGGPAVGMRVELWRVDGAPVLVKALTTNADGRSDGPVLAAGEAVDGAYELRFFVEDYLKTGLEAPFLGVVPIRFGLRADGGHYHVPLLVSPFGYSTYRGS